jgi:heptosyltransferase-3
MPDKPRILAIRGGAMGDFILTLPALRLLRETFAHCHLEILGYEHIAKLALAGGPAAGTTYADDVRSIEYGPLAGFFSRNGNLAPELCTYFAGFNQVVSWLFDPDKIFANNLERAGVKNYLTSYAKINDESHASVQLAHGLQSLALYIEDWSATLTPTEATKRAGADWLRAQGAGETRPTALHPGSGSPKKNWPLGNWRALARELSARGERLLLIGGEADAATLEPLAADLAEHRPILARSLPLPILAGVLAHCAKYVGHDTGVSHLAAAVGTPSTLLFGPTDPAIWAPARPKAKVIVAPEGDLASLPVNDVLVA